MYYAAKFLGATDTRGARFKVTTGAGCTVATVSFDYAAISPARAAVAEALNVSVVNVRPCFIRGALEFFEHVPAGGER